MKGTYFLAAVLIVIIVGSGLIGSRGPAHAESMFPIHTAHDAMHFGYEGFEEATEEAADETDAAVDSKPAPADEPECAEDETEGFRPADAAMSAYTGHEYSSF